MRAAIDLFLEHNRNVRENSEATVENYEHRLWMILGLPTNASRPMRWLNGRGAELYRASKVDRASDTHIGALSVARRWGAFCVKQKLIKVNPFADVEPEGKRRKGSTKDRLRVDESRDLQAACHVERGIDGTLTLAYLLLGARADEICSRVVRDRDDDGKLLWIDRTKTEAGSRRLEIPEELQPFFAELAEGKRPNDPLFVNLRGQPMSRRVAYQRVMKFTERIIGRSLGPQALRRTQSTLATDAGMAGRAVSAHLGHVTDDRMAAITQRSYVDNNAIADARTRAALRVIQGGSGNHRGNNGGNSSGTPSSEVA